MKPLAVGFGLLVCAGEAHAGPISIPTPLVEAQKPSKAINLRLVQDRLAEPTPIRSSGMIAQRTIARNAVVGIGLFKMTPKKFGSNDLRLDGQAPKSRKAAVSFQFRF